VERFDFRPGSFPLRGIRTEQAPIKIDKHDIMKHKNLLNLDHQTWRATT